MDARHTRRWVELGLLYGDFVFSVGIGGMFVNGVRLLSKVVG